MRLIKTSVAAITVLVAISLAAFPASSGQAVPNPKVLIRTEMGDITAEIFADKAPLTAANFLKYVEAELYEETVFFRTVVLENQKPEEIKIEVIQAAGTDEEKELLPIPLERTSLTGLRHLDGTLSMARGEPDSATSSFFICVNDQPELDFGGKRNKDGQGFASFGRVISGMDVVRKIQKSPREAQALAPPVKIISVTRIGE
jgi:peptidyl-prolyl cis-trans isomerase A (cyclophilin A)